MKSRHVRTYAHARNRLPLRDRWLSLAPAVLVAMVLAVAGGIAFASLHMSRDVRATARPRDPVLTAEYENRIGRYRFDYPFGWDVSARGAITEVKSPSRDAVVSFGLGGVSGVDPAESLSGSLNEVTQLIGDSYEGVRLTGLGSESIGGNPAVVRTGLATNDSGALIRFSVIVVQHAARNYVIVTFEPARLVSQRVHTTVGEIVESFAPEPASGFSAR